MKPRVTWSQLMVPVNSSAVFSAVQPHCMCYKHLHKAGVGHRALESKHGVQRAALGVGATTASGEGKGLW